MAAITPHNFRGTEGVTQLKTSSPAFSQFVAHKVRRPLWSVPNIGYDVAGTADNLESFGAGNPELAQINSSEICGFTAAANDDSYGQLWLIPSDIDIGEEIRFRVFWSESGTGGAGSAQYVIKYKELVTETTAVAIGATALDTVIAADTPSATANCLQSTPWGVMDADTLTSGGEGEYALATICTCTLTTISDATAYQAEVEYSRRFVG